MPLTRAAIVTSLALLGLPGVARAACDTSQPTDQLVICLAEELAAAQATIAELQADAVPGLGEYVWVDPVTDSVVFSGANVYVQSGAGATDGGSEGLNGLGNLIVGYSEDSGAELPRRGGPAGPGGRRGAAGGPVTSPWECGTN